MAVWYVSISSSGPAKALTIINWLLIGWWKLVTIMSAIVKSYGGKMNLFVQPSKAHILPGMVTALSRARIVVVPTQHTFLPFSLASCTAWHTSSPRCISSASMRCFDKSSTSIGLNSPIPACSVSSFHTTSLISIRFSSSRLKCSPAIGAATLPSFFA